MSQRSAMSFVAAVSVTLSGAAMLIGAPEALAKCGRQGNWVLPEAMTLIQDNNLQVLFGTNGIAAMDEAKYAHVGGNDWTYGTVSGRMDVDSVHFFTDWTAGPGAGRTNDYQGQIDGNGVITGSTTNDLGTVNTWRAQQNARCVEAPVYPKGHVNADVQVFDAPGGGGKVIGDLDTGRAVSVQERRPDGWAKIWNPTLPADGTGFVRSEFVVDG